MPRTKTLRPTSTSYLLPGMGQTHAHSGKPSSAKQSHRKLQGLDPLVARQEALSAQVDVTARVRSMGAQEASVPARPPRRSIKQLGRGLVRGVAKAMGLARGEPKPQVELLRHVGTSARAGEQEPLPLRSLATSLVQTMAAEEAAQGARIGLTEARSVDAIAGAQVDQKQADVELAARRYVHSSQRLQKLEQEVGVAAVLAATRDSIEPTARSLAATRSLIERIKVRREETSAALIALEALEPPERQWEQGASSTAAAARSTGSARARVSLRDLLDAEEEPETFATSIPSLQRPVDHICASLHSLLHAESQQELKDLDARIESLRELEAQQDALLGKRQARSRELEDRQSRLQDELAQARRSDLLAQQLWGHDEAVASLKAVRSELQPVIERRTAALDNATQASADAREAYARQCDTHIAQVLDGLSTFDGPEEVEPLREALRRWADGLKDRTCVFGSEAVPAALVLDITVQALSVASDGKAAEALQAVKGLSELSLHDVVPMPQAHEATAPSTPCDAAGRLARSLAAVPRGMQVLTLLLAPGPAPDKRRMEATRLYFHADDLMAGAAPEDENLRRWLGGARRAAARAVHASEPALALD
ncbi:MAG TPA: hypothetical protein VFP68_09410, partial [Burkholderiaceae bacterium]|nr:hypothetical protein [Burkholderiaceae bacterium]